MESKQKLFYLPEAHTDFIFAVLCEELGFIGGAIVLGFLRFMAGAGCAPRSRRRTISAASLALGITVMVAEPGADQSGRRAGHDADEGHSAAVHQLWRIEPVVMLLATGVLLNISQQADERESLRSADAGSVDVTRAAGRIGQV